MRFSSSALYRLCFCTPFLVVLLLFAVFSVQAQETEALAVTVLDSSTEQPVADATAELYDEDNELVAIGTTSSSGVVEFAVGTASKPLESYVQALGQSYPSPFEEMVTVPLTLSQVGMVTAGVFDVLGRRIALLETFAAAGTYALKVELPNQPAGQYFLSVWQDGRAVGTAPLVKVGMSSSGMPNLDLIANASAPPTPRAQNAQLVGKRASAAAVLAAGASYRLRVTKAGYVTQDFLVRMPDDRNFQAQIAVDDGNFQYVNSIGMEFVRIEAGTFQMGDHSGDGSSNDRPMHEVTISEDFYLGRYEVTQDEWEAVMGSNTSYFSGCGGDCPVERVSWNDVQAFVDSLNEMEGTDRYRLPTEAEWEYAARAETTTKWSFGDHEINLGDYVWYEVNSGGTTHPVGQKNPNPWGLYDVHGNVWEWVQDWYDSDYYESSPTVDPQGPETGSRRVGRGGSWLSTVSLTRSAVRGNNTPGTRNRLIGFRLLREDY